MTPHPTQASVGEVRHTPAEIIRAWCASCGYATPSDGDCIALAAALNPTPNDTKRLDWLSDSDSVYWLAIHAEPDRREVFNSSQVWRLRGVIDAAIARATSLPKDANHE